MVLASNEGDIGEWVEDNRRVLTKQFKSGLERKHVQMIRLSNQPQYQASYFEQTQI